MTNEMFAKHLEKLSEFYNTVSEDLPTADMILSGVVPIPTNLSVNDAFILGKDMHNTLVETIGSYDSPNPLVDEKLSRWFAFLETINLELHVFFLKEFYIKYPHLFAEINIPAHPFLRMLNYININE